MSQIDLVKARAVQPPEGARREMAFSDGGFGVADLNAFIQTGPMMAPLKDPAFFPQVFLGVGVPTWPNGCGIDPTAPRLRMQATGALRRREAAE